MEKLRQKNPLLAEYVKAVKKDIKRWRKKTGKRSRSYRPPVSFEQWLILREL